MTQRLPVIPPPTKIPLDEEILEQIHKLLINVAVYPCPKNPLKDKENDSDYQTLSKLRDWLRYEIYKHQTKEG